MYLRFNSNLEIKCFLVTRMQGKSIVLVFSGLWVLALINHQRLGHVEQDFYLCLGTKFPIVFSTSVQTILKGGELKQAVFFTDRKIYLTWLMSCLQQSPLYQPMGDAKIN